MTMKKMFYRLMTMVLSAAMCLSVLMTGVAHAEETKQDVRFDDVMPGQWYYSAIEYVVENGYFNGISEELFAPDSPMTRAMFVTVLGRFAGVEHAEGKAAISVFVDVEPGSYYCEYVGWAVENGIVQGYSANIFGYADYVTREQVAVFLYRYAKMVGLDVTIDRIATTQTFNSGSNASPWALNAVVWAMNKGIMRGVGNDLNPQAEVTRAQVAQIMMNFAIFAGK